MAKDKLKKYIKKRRNRISRYFIYSMMIVTIAVISFLMSQSGELKLLCGSILRANNLEDFREPSLHYPLSVHFIDVGNGDSILIKADDKTILIDTGIFSLNSDTAEYLRKAEVQRIDLFIASHTDSDHIGDFRSVADQFEIGKIWLSDYCRKEKDKQSEDEVIFYQTIREKNIKTESPELGIYDFGNFEIEVFAPIEKTKDDNENSLVLRLKYHDVTFLFTGDSGKKTEKMLLDKNINLKSDVLKAGHHGSNNSSTADFLKAVSPAYTVISAGEENIFLPNRLCVDRIKNCGSELLRTDLNGSVIFVSDGESISYITEK